MKTTFKTIFTLTIIALTGLVVLSGCDSGNEFESNAYAKVKIDLGGEMLQIGNQFLVVDENNPLNKYSRIDSTLIYGYGVAHLIPDSLKDSDLKIVVSGKMRESDVIKGSIAVTITDMKDSSLLWTEIPASKFVKAANAWTSFKDSLVVYKVQNTLSAKALKIFPFKNRGKGTFDVDDLQITIIKE